MEEQPRKQVISLCQDVAVIVTDYRTPEAKKLSKPLRKDGDEGVIGGFLGKEVHNVHLRLGVGSMKRG